MGSVHDLKIYLIYKFVYTTNIAIFYYYEFKSILILLFCDFNFSN